MSPCAGCASGSRPAAPRASPAQRVPALSLRRHESQRSSLRHQLAAPLAAAATLEAPLAEDGEDYVVRPPQNSKDKSRSRRFRDMARKVPGRTVEMGASLSTSSSMR